MNCIIFGHRGVPSLATENSIDSFNKILELNIPGVELDIHLSSDRKLVIIHDFNTKKLSGIDHKISETPWEILKEVTIGKSEKIPLLRDVFNLLGESVVYDLEVKSEGRNRRDLVIELLREIKYYNLEKRCLVSSFDPFIIKEFNRLKSGIKTGLIYCNDRETRFISKFGLGLFLTRIDIIKPHFKQLKGPLYYIYKNILKKDVYSWTVNSREDYNTAIKAGCKGICSNYPQNFNVEITSPTLSP